LEASAEGNEGSGGGLGVGQCRQKSITAEDVIGHGENIEAKMLKGQLTVIRERSHLLHYVVHLGNCVSVLIDVTFLRLRSKRNRARENVVIGIEEHGAKFNYASARIGAYEFLAH
jgi:hypothetical protein